MAKEYVLENPPATDPQLQQQDPPSEDGDSPDQERRHSLSVRWIAGGAAILALVLFITGLLAGRALFTQQIAPTPTPTPVPTLPPVPVTPTPTGFSELPADSVKYLPGKQYFEDTYVVVQKAEPHNALLLSVSRIEQERNYTQYIKLNYFDSVNWIRKTTTNSITSSRFAPNPLLLAFATPVTTSDQSEQQLLARVNIENHNIAIYSRDLENEISMQSLPGSTKFIYQGVGTIEFDKEKHDAYVFYAKSYSFNASDLAFFNNPEQLTLNWMVFWDNEGNFYHIDEYSTQRRSSPIENQKAGVVENKSRSVKKINSFTSGIEALQDKSTVYKVEYDEPIDDVLELKFSNIVNKSDKRTYSWILSLSKGRAIMNEGRAVPGVGIFEYIRRN